MPRITFTLQLDRSGTPANAARMWLDTSHDDLLQTGEEVTLGTIDGLIWIGDKMVSGSTVGMQFLVKFIAPANTKWSFMAVSEGATLHETKDQQMATTKESLAGRLK